MKRIIVSFFLIAFFTLLNAQVFQVIEGSFTWQEAKADAESRGGRLAVLNTQEKIDIINNYLSKLGTWPYSFIGLTDEDVEGDWRWVTGETLTVNNWRPGEPTGDGINDDYGIIRGTETNDLKLWLSTNGDSGSYLIEYVDSDGDGLLDAVETDTRVFTSVTSTGTNPNNADSDSDGLSDGNEVAWGTDPNDLNDPTNIYYVATNGDNSGSGQKFSPFATIQKAIDVSQNNDLVIVNAGIYSGPGNCAISLQGKNITVTSIEGPEVTILDLGNTQAFEETSAEFSDVVINGFSITKGFVTSNRDWGGIGIIHVEGDSALTVKNCIFYQNATTATYVTTNTAIIYQQGTSSSPVVVDNCLFHNNNLGGGGWTPFGGGTAAVVNTSGITLNCTIADNNLYSSEDSWPGYNGGILIPLLSSTRLSNNIVWGNTSSFFPNSSEVIYEGGGQTWDRDLGFLPSYSISQDGFIGSVGESAISLDPLFAEPLSYNYTLADNSPAINTGDPSLPKDPDGTRSDMGFRLDRFYPERVSSVKPTTWYSDAADLGNNWRYYDWLGYFNIVIDPWIYHMEHEWLYIFPSVTGPENIYFWDNDMKSVLWTSETTYPSMYRFSDDTWIWYLKTSKYPRWFNKLGTDDWEVYNGR